MIKHTLALLSVSVQADLENTLELLKAKLDSAKESIRSDVAMHTLHVELGMDHITMPNFKTYCEITAEDVSSLKAEISVLESMLELYQEIDSALESLDLEEPNNEVDHDFESMLCAMCRDEYPTELNIDPEGLESMLQEFSSILSSDEPDSIDELIADIQDSIDEGNGDTNLIVIGVDGYEHGLRERVTDAFPDMRIELRDISTDTADQLDAEGDQASLSLNDLAGIEGYNGESIASMVSMLENIVNKSGLIDDDNQTITDAALDLTTKAYPNCKVSLDDGVITVCSK